MGRVKLAFREECDDYRLRAAIVRPRPRPSKENPSSSRLLIPRTSLFGRPAGLAGWSVVPRFPSMAGAEIRSWVAIAGLKPRSGASPDPAVSEVWVCSGRSSYPHSAVRGRRWDKAYNQNGRRRDFGNSSRKLKRIILRPSRRCFWRLNYVAD